MALGILRVCYVSWLHQDWTGTGVCYVSWLHQDWTGTPILVQPFVKHLLRMSK
jgi:hypothetical protein